jgi:hypothetical protein
MKQACAAAQTAATSAVPLMSPWAQATTAPSRPMAAVMTRLAVAEPKAKPGQSRTRPARITWRETWRITWRETAPAMPPGHPAAAGPAAEGKENHPGR